MTSAQTIQTQLREVGLNLDLQKVDWGTYIALVNKGETQLGFSAST